MGFPANGDGIIDQVLERRHLNITACNPWGLCKGKVVHFWFIPPVGVPVERGTATITHIMDDGTLVFEGGLPDAVKIGDHMLAQY